MNLTEKQLRSLSGEVCGIAYERTPPDRHCDRLTFYIDGCIHFERFCYGEAAGHVFDAWANGIGTDGVLLWEKEPKYDHEKKALPRVLNAVEKDGASLQLDGDWRRYVKARELDKDKENGYGWFRLWRIRSKNK